MSYSPILVVHICSGILGLLSGIVAVSVGKGSHRHVLAGKVFVASMLTMAVAAVYLAITKQQPNNIGGGILTFYLISAVQPSQNGSFPRVCAWQSAMPFQSPWRLAFSGG